MEPRADPTPTDAAPEPRPTRRWRWIAAGTVATVAVAVVAFGVFGVHTLFIDEQVDEEGPVFTSGAELPAAVDEAQADEPSADGAPVDEAPVDEPSVDEPPVDETTTTAPPAAPTITTVASGTFTAVDHPGRGTVNVLTDGNQTFVRFEEDFGTDNGPDLFAVVYVGTERIELDVLKGNQGSQNYELPNDIDPSSVTKVGVWCKRFDSTFTEAALG